MSTKPRASSLREYFDLKVETQEALAARCTDAGVSVSQATLSRIADGANCSITLAKKIAELTGVPLESFGEAA